MLTIIMYHYVRDLPRTRFPGIKGLPTEKFEGQLDYIAGHYTPCTLKQVVVAAHGGAKLPENACLLTFDDGFIDHYLTVFPRLQARGIPASFYPAAQPVEENKVLDVHKTHFILASAEEPEKLLKEILEMVKEYRKDHDIPGDDELRRMYLLPDRYDSPEVVFIKKVLQRGLPEDVRSGIVARLFAGHVSNDEADFARELYMSVDQLRFLASRGMEIGGHGYCHAHLDALSRSGQQAEIRHTVELLTKIYGHKPQDWTMSYPYGSYNSVTTELLGRAGCALGLTTRVGLVKDLSKPLELNRMDTNDIPFSKDATPPKVEKV